MLAGELVTEETSSKKDLRDGGTEVCNQSCLYTSCGKVMPATLKYLANALHGVLCDAGWANEIFIVRRAHKRVTINELATVTYTYFSPLL